MTQPQVHLGIERDENQLLAEILALGIIPAGSYEETGMKILIIGARRSSGRTRYAPVHLRRQLEG